MSASGSALPSVQAADPVDVLYFPATHAVHGPPFGPVDPMLQVQLVKAALPAGETEFDGQAVHDAPEVCPVAVPYLPAQHRHGSVHTHQPFCLVVLHSCPLLQGAVLVCSISLETRAMVHTQ
jgi:hypothetical protein